MKRSWTIFFLVNLILSACASVSAPTPTPVPSATPLPTTTTAAPTNTAVPTATPTPIPTIQVGDLSVPDPRVTNPELFALIKRDAPIPQFANALKNAGIDVSPEQIAQGITFVSTKEDGSPLVDENGNRFFLAVYNLNIDSTKQTESLPLIIIKQNKETGQWELSNPTIKQSGRISHRKIGVVLFPHVPSKLLQQQQFGYGVVTFQWYRREPQQGSFNLNYTYNQLSEAKSAQMDMRLAHLIDNHTCPEWVNKINNPKELETVIRNHIRNTILFLYENGVTEFNVVNEPFRKNNHFYNIFGDEYIRISFDEAFKVRNEIIKKAQENNQKTPSILFGLSNADNHYSGGYGTERTLELLQFLKRSNLLPDYVDLHFHIKNTKKLPPEKDILETIEKYRALGVDVTVGEFDVNINDIPSNNPNRFVTQAEIYKNLLNIMIKADINRIIFWGVADEDSWYLPDEPHADALLFAGSDGNYWPKLSYYYILASLLLQ